MKGGVSRVIMPLSRHFYNIDEVYAALSYCCRERKITEALFWLYELIQSDEAELGCRAMIEVYLMRYGVRHLSWFNGMYDLMNEDVLDNNKLLAMCVNLCRLDQKDVSLLSLALVNISDLKNGFPPIRLNNDIVRKSGETPIEKYFINAIHGRKIRGALWAAPRCRTQIIIDTAVAVASTMPAVYQKAFYAAKDLNSWSELTYCPLVSLIMCFMIICIEPSNYGRLIEPLELIDIPPAYFAILNEWNLLEGRRARRIYSIPCDGLYLSCKRGLMPYTEDTMKVLRQLGSGSLNADEC
jgi:hypothetical protein